MIEFPSHTRIVKHTVEWMMLLEEPEKLGGPLLGEVSWPGMGGVGAGPLPCCMHPHLGGLCQQGP